ncbi:arogenate dehydratase/prephenate dehydratase 2, chloroplastic-like protein [Cinnamomum micranthum f. kanehirae]|uniref:Arogenate dehydratase/prephenate dehydratase 2, chloroplastic-like protein n=1 Tax=Cinnamomum micranthum f. kanehirae TaxID=337451 RepID=A0A443PWL1_9MAGN|nr:arogenate dehydratase/prephenate dehydratase 2, chloroplastic-like protein [Cinnamomum micranthum f. kanehirae]
MALRVAPIPISLRSASPSSSEKIRSRDRSQIRNPRCFSLKSNLKQQRRGTQIAPPDLSPLLPTEETAARFGLEMTVVELERLFKQAAFGGDHLLRKLSGPFHPSLPSGSSGRPVRVAYQGVRGSYCQEAAVKAFSSVSNCDAFPCDHMEDAFQALNDRSADRAVIPVENSIDGPIDRNLDLLLRHDGIRIVGELILPVNHCLLALPGVSRSDLRRIVSHPQALSHCRTNLAAAADLEIDEVPNSADAARYVSEDRIADTAVIGSKIAAREFGLEVLEQNFQDPNGNFNRFLQLGLETGAATEPEGEKSRNRKTTVAFSLENGVSDLFRALWHFETRDIPVVRVEHRPNRSSPVRVAKKEKVDFGYMDYVFIVDLEGSVSDSEMKSALVQLEEISGFVRVLGSYKCGLLH